MKARWIAAVLLAPCVFLLVRCLAPDPVVANSPAGPGPMVAIGDSITAGVGAGGPGASWAAILGKRLGREIVNRGIGGDTAIDAIDRFDKDVMDEDPAVVFILLGGNDLLRRLPVDDTFAALDQMVERATDAGALVVLIGIEGLPMVSADYGERFQELADRHYCLYVPDILDGLLFKKEFMADQIHPNAKGHTILADRIEEALRPHLDE